jgi:sulfur-oxidizing protein SoxY
MARSRPSRRRFLAGAGVILAGTGLSVVTLRPASATPAAMADAIRKVIGDAAVLSGRVKIDVPALVENGNAVPISVSVESPMTEADHVKAVHVFNEKNPQPDVASFHLTARSGRAAVSTRIRLADTQKLVAVAELSDGSFWSASVDVIVTLAACLETN